MVNCGFILIGSHFSPIFLCFIHSSSIICTCWMEGRIKATIMKKKNERRQCHNGWRRHGASVQHLIGSLEAIYASKLHCFESRRKHFVSFLFASSSLQSVARCQLLTRTISNAMCATNCAALAECGQICVPISNCENGYKK